jgi:hypothetical protein
MLQEPGTWFGPRTPTAIPVAPDSDPAWSQPMRFEPLVGCRLGTLTVLSTASQQALSATECGIPSTAAALAVNLSSSSQRSGALTVWGDASAPSPFETQRLVAGEESSLGTIIAVGETAQVLARWLPDGEGPDSATVIVDASGYFVPETTPTGSYLPLVPCRVLDTRSGGAAIAHGESRAIPVAGECGVPAAARAVSLTLTVPSPAARGEIALVPEGEALAPPSARTGLSTGTTTLGAIVPLTSGGVLLTPTLSGATGQIHAVVDVTGYYR